MKKTTETGTEQGHPFQRLQAQLASLIASTPPGGRLPSEPELAQQLKVSRATLREAMRTFDGQGLVRRRQGVGTFVVGYPQVMDAGLEMLESIESMASRIHLDVTMGDLQIKQIQANAHQADMLKVEPGVQLVQVSRVILAEDRPVAFLVDLLPEDVLSPADLSSGFTGSVLDFLLRHQQAGATESYTEIKSLGAPSEVARALEIQRGDVLLLLEARLLTLTGRVLDYSHGYFSPGYFRFHVVRRVAPLPPA